MKKLLIIGSIILLSACNSGGSNSAAGTFILAGNWGGSFASTNNNVFIVFDMTILQTGASTGLPATIFSGIYRVSQKNCGIIGGTFTGTISGTQVTFLLSDNGGATITFNGNITGALQGIARSMSGLLNSTGAICGSFTGSWSMVLI